MAKSGAKKSRIGHENNVEATGFTKFIHAMLDASQKHLKPEPEEMEAMGEAFHNHLFDLDGPRQIRSRPATPRKLYFSKIFYGFTEIYDSLEMLKDILFLVGRFPYSNTRVSRERYLQFLVESHFGEIYVLQERLKQYFTVVDRQYKTDPKHPEINNTCKNLRNLIVDVLKGILEVRHNHIHQARFSDKSLDRLKSIGLLANHSSDKLGQTMKIYYQSEHLKIRKEWQEKIKNNNEAIFKLMNVVSNRLHPIIFDDATLDFKFPTGV